MQGTAGSYRDPPPRPAAVIVQKDVGGIGKYYQAQTELDRRSSREVIKKVVESLPNSGIENLDASGSGPLVERSVPRPGGHLAQDIWKLIGGMQPPRTDDVRLRSKLAARIDGNRRRERDAPSC